jgi:ATP-dependent RNA helicase DDX35
MYPVEVCYLKEPCVDYCEAAVQTVFNIHLKVSSTCVLRVLVMICCSRRQEPPGDVLVFLTGREEIDQVIQQVTDRLQS